MVLSGWGSNNKYALLAAFRSVAQLLSYEVPLVIALLVPVMLSGSLSLNGIVRGQTVPYVLLAPVAAFVFFLTSIAEVGRSPFDLTEAESELVAGFNLEYSGLKFGMFYVADFLHAFTISLLFAVLFLGGWHGPYAEQYPMLGLLWFFLKAGVVYFIGVWMRVSFPRFRIDQMMAISWKILTPLAIASVILTALIAKLIPEGGLIQFGSLVAANLVLVVVALVLFSLNKRETTAERIPTGCSGRICCEGHHGQEVAVSAAQVIFILVAAVTLFSAVMVVSVRRMMHAALWLIVTLLGVAVLFVLLQAGFFAVVQVLIYIGAIAILIIFAVMLTRQVMSEKFPPTQSRLGGGIGSGRRPHGRPGTGLPGFPRFG